MAFLNMNKTFNTHLPKYSAQARKQSWPWRKKTYHFLNSHRNFYLDIFSFL